MKFCQKCGKELLDEAVICVGCGCVVENKVIINEQKTSTFLKNRKQWIIVLYILFVVFTGSVILLLTSSGYDEAIDLYQFYHSDLGQLGKNLSALKAIEWQQKVDSIKATLITYYVGVGVCGALSLTTLIGAVILFFSKKREQ